MIRRTFNTTPVNAIAKMEELINDGWTIITSANTSTPETAPDAYGISYGGASFDILCERKYEKPSVLASSSMFGIPCNPPAPAGR